MFTLHFSSRLVSSRPDILNGFLAGERTYIEEEVLIISSGINVGSLLRRVILTLINDLSVSMTFVRTSPTLSPHFCRLLPTMQEAFHERTTRICSEIACFCLGRSTFAMASRDWYFIGIQHFRSAISISR